MIEARIAGEAMGFVARLATRARTLAQSSAESRRRARTADPWRWRHPRLLWPLFTKD